MPAWSARREILGQVLRYDAKLSALDFSVRDQFRKNLLRGSRGNRKAEADAAARRTDDSAVDADHAPIEVQQRTTGIARVDGGIRLDVPFIGTRLKTGSPKRADNAMRSGL